MSMADIFADAELAIGQLASGIITAKVLEHAISVLIEITNAHRGPDKFATWQDAALDERAKLVAAKRELDLAFSMLEINGVPKERARTVSNGIDVLVTRMDRELQFLRAELADLKQDKP